MALKNADVLWMQDTLVQYIEVISPWEKIESAESETLRLLRARLLETDLDPALDPFISILLPQMPPKDPAA